MKPGIRTPSCGILLLAFLFMAGCGGLFRGSPPGDPEALALAGEARDLNRGILFSRGTAWLTLGREGKPDQRYRLAWAAAFPDRIRMTLLSSGLPVETLVADGSSVRIVSHNGSHPPHTLNSPDPSLESLLAIPVRLGDIIGLLSGRIPLPPFDRAAWSGDDTGDGRVLVLSRRWGGSVARLEWNPLEGFRCIQVLDRNQNPVYSVFREEIKPSGAFPVPRRYRISDGDGRNLAAEITRFEPNTVIGPEVFILTDSRE
jgi:hypothetical protein